MMSTVAHSITVSGLVSRSLRGVAAGIVGGLVFGMMMAMMGMLPMVAMLVGSKSAAVGMFVHLVISAGLGALLALVAPMAGIGSLLAVGAVYGAVWWVLGALIIMPAWLGMPLFMFDSNAWLSLMGHVVFGMVAAGVLAGIRRRVGHA
jgi:uncharacterized membrane protein YagU involved in acid resistance